MVNYYNWQSVLRQILEDLYYGAGVAIAIAAFKGLGQLKVGAEQLKLTREIADSNIKIARTNAKREAIKLAAERCQYFAEHTVPDFAKMGNKYHELKLTFLSQPAPQWSIVNGDIVNHNFNAAVQDAEVPRFVVDLVNSTNSVEAFAIPFVAGVADDDIGFQETALGFCQQVKELVPAIWYLRQKNMARYQSTIQLFDLWNKRLVASAMAPLMKSMEATIKAANDSKIKPLGTE